MAEATPMMQQYLEAKGQCEDCILFFRLGDFYEMFADDARLVSKELDLTLTTRDRGKENPEERVPMCGVPYHSSEAYIARLIAKGYKVAICEQMEDPALAKGLVKREIIRVVTPGTVLDASMLEEGRSNYICAVYLDGEGGAAAFSDVSTGEVCAAGFRGEGAASHLVNELGRFRPAEAVLSDAAWENEEITAFLQDRLGCRRERGGEARFLYANAAAACVSQFGEAGLSVLPPAQPEPLMAVGGLL
ncbi:MAG TPA: DNA mismatch repair protein MutS, partial [Oscillospiraceae bacterium]|nr:DNA mismatch repair protein MutS [Oscillospiraceae bacterium]